MRKDPRTLKEKKIRKIQIAGFNSRDYICVISKKISEDDALQLEILLIKSLGRIDNDTGILANHTDGGEGTVGCSTPWAGKTLIEYYGKERVAEINRKIRATRSRPVKQLDFDRNLVKIWSGGVREAAESLGIKALNIYKVLNKKNKNYYITGGSLWEFVDESNEKYKSKFLCRKQLFILLYSTIDENNFYLILNINEINEKLPGFTKAGVMDATRKDHKTNKIYKAKLITEEEFYIYEARDPNRVVGTPFWRKKIDAKTKKRK